MAPDTTGTLLHRRGMPNTNTIAANHSFNLFRRCVNCPNETPSCPPSCGSDESCQLISASCDVCQHTICAKNGALPGQLKNEESSSSPTGPIAGGVVGGVVVLALIGFLIWWFILRPKKTSTQSWPDEKRSTMRAGDRRSTHSQRSVASTVWSRASNVIQIAYIPGVTVRSPPESPGLVPPVPPLPTGGPGANGQMGGPEQHFFMPSDLRASTWSDASSVNNRISLSPSLARTTYYGAEAEVIPPVPAQQAFRAQANMVSVKSGSNTPAMSAKSPAVQQMSKMGQSSIVAKNVTARPIEIRKGNSNTRVPTLGNLKEAASSKATSQTASERSVPVFFDEKELASPIESEKEVVSPTSIISKPSNNTLNTHRSSSVSGISRILPVDGPLARSNNHRHSKSEGLNAMIEQALKAATGSEMKRPDLVKQDSGPFSDAHEIDGKENRP
jgi:protein OPY2